MHNLDWVFVNETIPEKNADIQRFGHADKIVFERLLPAISKIEIEILLRFTTTESIIFDC